MEHRETARVFLTALARSAWAYLATISTVLTIILLPEQWYWALPAGVSLVVVIGAIRAVAGIQDRNRQENRRLIQENERLREEIRRSARDRLAEFTLRCKVVGEPPERQFIRVGAREPITITSVEYLLADGTVIEAEDLKLEGEAIDVPISDEHVLAVQLMPQPQRSRVDGSAPIHFRLHYRVRGNENFHTLPAWIRPTPVGSTYYRKIVG